MLERWIVETTSRNGCGHSFPKLGQLGNGLIELLTKRISFLVGRLQGFVLRLDPGQHHRAQNNLARLEASLF